MTERAAIQLDRHGLERLLAFLGATGGSADEAYRRAHGRVESFFRWKGLSDCGRLADETLDRVARRLAEGAVRTEQPHAFMLGVARLVALEARRRDGRLIPLGDEPLAAPAEDEGDRERAAALERCLDSLAEPDRELLLRYHREEGRQRIDGRQRLADALGLGLATLRVRAFRIRQRLEQCVLRRVAEMEGSQPPLEGR